MNECAREQIVLQNDNPEAKCTKFAAFVELDFTETLF